MEIQRCACVGGGGCLGGGVNKAGRTFEALLLRSEKATTLVKTEFFSSDPSVLIPQIFP